MPAASAQSQPTLVIRMRPNTGGAGVINSDNTEWIDATKAGLQDALQAGVKVGERGVLRQAACLALMWPYAELCVLTACAAPPE